MGDGKKARAAVSAARKRPWRGRLRFLAVNAAKVGLSPPLPQYHNCPLI